MSLQLNQRIKTLSDQLTESTGSDLGSFASEITSSIGSISNSLSTSTNEVIEGWSDSVSASTASMANSIVGYLASASAAASSISSAASAVSALKSAADSYVKAYEKYKSSEYYNDKPPANCKDEAAWRREKNKMEDDVKAKEATATAAENTVKGCFDSGASASDSVGGGYEVTTLTGKDLTQFCKDNYLNSKNVIVKKTKVDINNVVYDLYYVYDKNMSYKNSAFETYVDNCIAQLSKLDSNTLDLVSSTKLIFQQSYKTDNGNFQNTNQTAVYESDKEAIHSVFQETERLNKFNEGAILHEFGHAVDNNVSKAEGGDINSFLTEGKENARWKQLARQEGTSLRSASGEIVGMSGYTASDYNNMPAEFLAECFYIYHSSDSNRRMLKRYCPETYKEIERLSSRAKLYGGVGNKA